jgi:hypothetical protein
LLDGKSINEGREPIEGVDHNRGMIMRLQNQRIDCLVDFLKALGFWKPCSPGNIRAVFGLNENRIFGLAGKSRFADSGSSIN